MIIKFANTWANWLVENGASRDDYEIYAYGAECMLNELFSDLLLIITALLFHKTFEMILWMLFFTPLRIHLGGMHASSHLKCILSSILLSYLCIFTYPLIIEFPPILGFILAISIFIVYKIAPVVHPNHPVSENRMLQMRKRALFILFVEIIIACIAYGYFSKIVAGIATVSIFSVCVLAMLGKLHSYNH
ncbi:accessory regulator protein B [Anaerotignum neopropionicum]|uniref:Accessory regulator protein B n=1 Tax=Anaerotignum neopropionicum TaxID=36847 RepID=A0A136WAU8_9FIRM|nr:accessory gene regulator B family protein [Anaerotignum neopropionicum]KXL51652.1 accessory regulator protein B [Anaerotignum neopropionicum]